MKKLPVAAHLSDTEFQLLMKIYADHNRSMGFEERMQHTLSDIVKVVRNSKEKCWEVHYQSGNWWHYSVDGSWY